MKRIILAFLLSTPIGLFAQNYNPFVAQGIVSPAPLDDVASGGTGIVSFLVGNTGDDALPLVANQEMLLVITLSRGEPNNVDPIAAIGGDYASYFDWQYDPGSLSYLGTQNKLIPDALNGGVGSIEILYKVTSNSLKSSPQNGFNVNLTPPAYTNGINSLNDDNVSSYTWTVPPSKTKPDMNATFVDSTVSGKVATNDNVPAGSTYGTPVAVSTNPGPSTIVMQPDGTYTFTAPAVGVYEFNVPVCPVGQTTNCPTELLTITVTDPKVNTNPPTANLDEATTIGQTPVTLNTLGNDACNNKNCSLAPGSVTVVVDPLHGTVTVDPLTGNITYTANPTFYGVDTLTYSVCDSTISPVKCVTSQQIITVLPLGTKNLIALNDDYRVLPINTIATGSVITNDKDPENDNISTTPQNTAVPNKGTFVLDANGGYTFTPNNGFSGTVEIPYDACDDGTPQACSRATLYITINPLIPVLPIVLSNFNVLENNCDVTINWKTNSELNSNYFAITRKHESENSFKEIGRVKAAGNSSSEQSYMFKDNPTLNGKYAYQLKIVDIDESASVSSVQNVSLTCGQTNDIQVYPNPATDMIHIKIYSDIVDVFMIKITDMAGRTVVETETEVDAKTKDVTLNMTSFASGLYNISVSSLNENKVFKVQKVN